MKKTTKRRFMAYIMACVLLFSFSTVSVSANDGIVGSGNIDTENGIVIYNANSARIRELDKALLEAEAVLYNYIRKYGEGVCVPENKEYSALVMGVELIKEQLDELDAIPSEDFLYELNFHAPLGDEVQAGDIEDFYYQFEDAFNLSHTIDSYVKNGITYEVCDISIHDAQGGNQFGSYLEEIDLFEDRETYYEILTEEYNEAKFQRKLQIAAQIHPITQFIYGAAVAANEFVVDIMELRDRLDQVDGITNPGLTKKYDFYCSAVSNPHFVFVRVGSGAWQHSYTYNNVQIIEEHSWRLHLYIDNILQRFGDDPYYQYSLGHDQDTDGGIPSEICQDAVNAYLLNYLYADPITVFKIDLSSISQNEGIVNFDIICPSDQFELFQIGIG